MSTFETVMSVDMRVQTDFRTVEVTERGKSDDRWSETGSAHSWVGVMAPLDTALDVCAHTLRVTPMEGISGDMPERRQHLAAILTEVRAAVQELDRDAEADGRLTDTQWTDAVARIAGAVHQTLPVEMSAATSATCLVV